MRLFLNLCKIIAGRGVWLRCWSQVKKDALQLPSLNCISEEVGGPIFWPYVGFSSPLLMHPCWCHLGYHLQQQGGRASGSSPLMVPMTAWPMKTMTRKWIEWQAAKPRSQWTSTQPQKVQIVHTLTHNMMPFLLLWGTSLVGLIFSVYAFVFSERSLFNFYSNSIGQNPENSVSTSPKKQI